MGSRFIIDVLSGSGVGNTNATAGRGVSGAGSSGVLVISSSVEIAGGAAEDHSLGGRLVAYGITGSITKLTDGTRFLKASDTSIVNIATGSNGQIVFSDDSLAFKTISVSGQDNVVADTNADTLTLVAGSNMTITTTAGTDTITFASSGGGGSSGPADSVGWASPVVPQLTTTGSVGIGMDNSAQQIKGVAQLFISMSYNDGEGDTDAEIHPPAFQIKASADKAFAHNDYLNVLSGSHNLLSLDSGGRLGIGIGRTTGSSNTDALLHVSASVGANGKANPLDLVLIDYDGKSADASGIASSATVYPRLLSVVSGSDRAGHRKSLFVVSGTDGNVYVQNTVKVGTSLVSLHNDGTGLSWSPDGSPEKINLNVGSTTGVSVNFIEAISGSDGGGTATGNGNPGPLLSPNNSAFTINPVGDDIDFMVKGFEANATSRGLNVLFAVDAARKVVMVQSGTVSGSVADPFGWATDEYINFVVSGTNSVARKSFTYPEKTSLSGSGYSLFVGDVALSGTLRGKGYLSAQEKDLFTVASRGMKFLNDTGNYTGLQQQEAFLTVTGTCAGPGFDPGDNLSYAMAQAAVFHGDVVSSGSLYAHGGELVIAASGGGADAKAVASTPIARLVGKNETLSINNGATSILDQFKANDDSVGTPGDRSFSGGKYLITVTGGGHRAMFDALVTSSDDGATPELYYTSTTTNSALDGLALSVDVNSENVRLIVTNNGASFSNYVFKMFITRIQ